MMKLYQHLNLFKTNAVLVSTLLFQTHLGIVQFPNSRYWIGIYLLVKNFRSSRSEVFCKKSDLEDFEKFTEDSCAGVLPFYTGETLFYPTIPSNCFYSNII